MVRESFLQLVSMDGSEGPDYLGWMPVSLRKILRAKYWEFRAGRVRRKILGHYASREKTAEETAVIGYLAGHPLRVFPYDFVEKYSLSDVVVDFDTGKGLPYADYHGERLYYPRDMPGNEIRASLQKLLVEQDPASPHRYLTPAISPGPGDVVADIGSAEGTFSLDVVERAERLYLFEPEARWHEPLRATFGPWSDKVVVVPALVSDTDGHGSTSLDAFFRGREEEVHFLKVDAEGAEREVLAGAREVLTREHSQKGVICTYNRQDDGPDICRTLRELGFTASYSGGYMIYYFDEHIREPYLRRGLIRFTRQGPG